MKRYKFYSNAPIKKGIKLIDSIEDLPLKVQKDILNLLNPIKPKYLKLAEKEKHCYTKCFTICYEFCRRYYNKGYFYCMGYCYQDKNGQEVDPNPHAVILYQSNYIDLKSIAISYLDSEVVKYFNNHRFALIKKFDPNTSEFKNLFPGFDYNDPCHHGADSYVMYRLL